MVPLPAEARTPTCFGKKATIIGTRGADRLIGTKRADIIVGKGGADEIVGKGGADLICAGGGNDVIIAGRGNDRIKAGAGHDLLVGQGGHDLLGGGGGNDVFAGVAGDDRYVGGLGFDLATFELATGPVTVDLGLGLASGEGNDTISGVEGVYGSSFDDTIRGGAAPDVLSGGPGNDLIEGSADDLLFYVFSSAAVTVDLTAGTATGGEGNDTLVSLGNVLGSGFDDSLTGTTGRNYLDGWEGNDSIDGQGGADICIGETQINCAAEAAPPPGEDPPPSDAPPPPPSMATARTTATSDPWGEITPRSNFMRRQTGSGGLLDVDTFSPASRTVLAVRWDHPGNHRCDEWRDGGGSDSIVDSSAYEATIFGPRVPSSGYVAWIPKYVMTNHGSVVHSSWGSWTWAYRDSVWRSYTTHQPVTQTFNYGIGTRTDNRVVYVQNWVYDYDTGWFSWTWSRTQAWDLVYRKYVEGGPGCPV